MNLIDRVARYVSPSWALKRAHAREALRTFDPFDRTQRTGVLSAQRRSPREEFQQIQESKLDRIRRLDAENPLIHGVLNLIPNNVVGSGFQFEARQVSTRGKPRTRLNEDIEAAFGEFLAACDTARGMSFGRLTWLVERELNVAGEIFVRLHVIDRKPALELVSSEKISNANDTMEPRGDGSQIVDGVEIDRNGRPIAYHVEISETNIVRVPAKEMVHLFREHRPGQIRGITPLASVVKECEELAQFLDFELTKARSAAAFVAMIKKGGANHGGFVGADDNAKQKKDIHGNTIESIVGGMLLEAGPNDSVEVFPSGIQSTALEQFIRLRLRMIAAGLNVSYEHVSRDYSTHHFGSSRMSLLEDRRGWRPRQTYLIEFAMRIWRWWVDIADLGQAVRKSEIDVEAVEWIPEGWDWVDPEKDRRADLLGVKSGMQSISEVASRHGGDIEKNVEELAKVRDLLTEKGLALPEEVFGSGTKTTEEATEEKRPKAGDDAGDDQSDSGDGDGDNQDDVAAAA